MPAPHLISPPIRKDDHIRLVTLWTGGEMEAMFEMDQYFETSPDGSTLHLWQTTPLEFHAQFGARVIVSKCPMTDVQFRLTETEAEAVWDPFLRRRFTFHDRVQIIVFRDGSHVEAAAGQFFQTNRDGTLMQLWQMSPDGLSALLPMGPDARTDLVSQWPRDSVRWALSDLAVQSARQFGSLRDILGP